MRAADLPLLVAFGIVVAFPVAFGSFTAYKLGLLLIYGIVGQGVALCWGRLGFLPLGQAVFFGLGAYLGGGALIAAEDSWLRLIPMIVGAVLAPAALAGLIGLLVFRRQTGSGPFFSLATLALSMLAYQIALSANAITGGFNGLTGIPPLPGTDPWGNFYWVIVGALVVSTLAMIWVARSPVGRIWSAIAQNELRLTFLGYDIAAHKALAFAISGVLAGMAGVLFAAQQGIVTPQALGYLLSGEFLIWTAVGGRASIIGPVVGAVLIGFLTSELRDTLPYWEILLALLFLVIVLKAPAGLAGLAAPLLNRLPRRSARDRTLEQTLRSNEAMPRLLFDDVQVRMGSVGILTGLSLDLASRRLHCLIGPNGAGKTSAFNALTGRLPVASGRIMWRDTEIRRLPPHRVARLGIGRKLQVPSIFPDLDVGAHIDISLWSAGLSMRDALGRRSFRWRNAVLDELYALFPFLADEDRRAGDLSLGHRQMLEFAMSVLARPALVLLDEPCAGLSTEETSHMTGAIARIAENFGISALIIEHDFSVVEALSDHVFVMHQGRLLAHGTLDAIKANPDVQQVYAGGVK